MNLRTYTRNAIHSNIFYQGIVLYKENTTEKFLRGLNNFCEFLDEGYGGKTVNLIIDKTANYGLKHGYVKIWKGKEPETTLLQDISRVIKERKIRKKHSRNSEKSTTPEEPTLKQIIKK